MRPFPCIWAQLYLHCYYPHVSSYVHVIAVQVRAVRLLHGSSLLHGRMHTVNQTLWLLLDVGDVINVSNEFFPEGTLSKVPVSVTNRRLVGAPPEGVGARYRSEQTR